MKHTNDLLGMYSGESLEPLDYDSLGRLYASEIEESDIRDNNRMKSRYEVDNSASKLASMKKRIADELSSIHAEETASVPVMSTFELHQAVKNASVASKRDIGLRSLTAHVEKLWTNDRDGFVDHQGFSVLRDHYARQYPKSAAAEVLDKAAKSGYMNLNKSELMELAANIQDQEDFDYLMRVNGYDSNTPRNEKARKFVLAVLNKTGSSDSEVIEIVSDAMKRSEKNGDNWADAVWLDLEAEGYEVVPVSDISDTDLIVGVVINDTKYDVVYSQYESRYWLSEQE